MSDSTFPPPPDPTRPVPPPADDTLAVPPPPASADPTAPLAPAEVPPPPPPASYPPAPTSAAYPPPPQTNPYGGPVYGGAVYGSGVVDHPQGTTVLIMGILSLVLCGILGPFAWMMGNRALAEIDANPGRYANRSTVNAGRICGIISTVFLGLALVVVVIVMVLGGIAAVTSGR